MSRASAIDRVIYSRPGAQYPGDKTITAKVWMTNGVVLWFRLSDTVPEARQAFVLRVLIREQRGKRKYIQPTEKAGKV